ncbi:MAG: DUF642 domain-containing protein, partial [Burkholderiaceae bacterium]
VATTTDAEVGGLAAGDGNLITGSCGNLAVATNGGTGFALRGNFIGSNAAGTARIGFRTRGWNNIGGTVTVREMRRNLFVGNSAAIAFESDDTVTPVAGQTNWVFAGNHVGVGRDGSTLLANTIGLGPIDASQATFVNGLVIGGTATADRNVFAGNDSHAIWLRNPTGAVRIVGNRIGVAADGTTVRGNAGDGIRLETAQAITVGGLATNEPNTIANNGGRGVNVVSGTGAVTIRGNVMYANTTFGIDLGNDGTTSNDGAKTSGQPNQWMDTPVFASAVFAGDQLQIVGRVGSAPGQVTFNNATVDVYRSQAHSSGFGEGRIWLGTLTADANGVFEGRITVPAGVTLVAADAITGTATDGSGFTSEFSPNLTIAAAGALQNGSFETSPAQTLGLVHGTTSITGWTVLSSDIDLLTAFTAADGTKSLDLSGYNAGGIQQSFATVPGTCYSVVFSLAGNPGVARVYTLQTTVPGATLGTTATQTFTFDTTGRSASAMGWVTRTVEDAATSALSTVSFRSLDAGNAGPALDNVRIAPYVRVSGRVYEDANYGGGAGRDRTTAIGAGLGRPNATVEAYDASGVFLSSTTTDANGDYSFLVVGNTTYQVRVVNQTVSSARTGWSNTLRPVQTWRAQAVGGVVTAVIDRVGGENPALQDAAANTGTQTLAALTAGSLTAQSVSSVGVATSDLTGLDFGFNFSTIVNVNDTGQGSLRQFVTNANALGGESSLAQAGQRRNLAGSPEALPAGVETSIFMVPGGSAVAGLRAGLASQLTSGVARITLASNLPTVSSGLTALDATTQTVNVGDTYAVTLGTGGTVGVDALLLPQGPGPEVTVVGPGLNVFALTGADLQVRGFAITRANAAVYPSGAVRPVIELNVLGTEATAFSDPGSGSRQTQGVYADGATSAPVIRRNLIGWATQWGIYLGTAGQSFAIDSNELRGNSRESAGADGFAPINTNGGTFTGNLVTDTGGMGVDVWNGASNGTYTNNTVTRSGLLVSEPGGIRIAGSGNTLDRNLLTANYGAGAIVLSGANNRFTRNHAWANGGVTAWGGTTSSRAIGIDLAANGATANDGALSSGSQNNLMDAPVFTSVSLSGTTLTVAGYVGLSTNSTAFGGATVEVFTSDVDPSGSGGGQTFLGTLTTSTTAGSIGTFSGTIDVTGKGLAGGMSITGTATLSPNGTSEFGPNAAVPVVVSGTVFEDVNYGGGAGRSQSASSGVARSNATVELYTAAGAFVSSTTTGADGSYRFNVAPNASYKVRVVQTTVRSSRTGWVSGLLPVQTYRVHAAAGTVTAVTNEVGGASSTSTSVETAAGTLASSGAVARSVSDVQVGTSPIAGIDFGFNFSTIVNTNDAGHGSLRQFILNANALGDRTGLLQAGFRRTSGANEALPSGIESSIFMVPSGAAVPGIAATVPSVLTSGVARITVSSALPAVTGTNVSIDGSTQTVNVGDTNT